MRIGFLSHSDMSIYYFRLLIMRALKDAGHKVYAIMPKGAYEKRVGAEFECVFYDIDGASINPLRVGKNALNLAKALAPLHLDMLQSAAHKSNVFGT
ncbi:MAG: glycosyltransferase family 1 protein, partial [Campylobacter sp.]|nr:glycosyltransferase family 1 protein [Campylobacter sp.]